ncbi:hypothetical protein Clacol_008934 [Clathrus columnatus]|uniref:Hydrophobin n=1 Tax=Clathrus columnatus TaxID=1419009 RepID=A0AAV5APQ6_9AGAM|nr:hypothetical protein Clacol_008934 [Clathrus columnatus]
MKAVFATLSLAALAVAIPQSVSQCNTDSTSTLVQELEGLLGIALGSITGQVGLGCSPITGVGIGTGADCAQQPVCCAGNEFQGLIGIGCTPLTL